MVKYNLEEVKSLIKRNIGKIISEFDYSKEVYQLVYRQTTSFSNNDLNYFMKYFEDTPKDWVTEWRIEPCGTRDVRVILFLNKKVLNIK